MKLIKVKGIVIKETVYKDNDKIVTLLTDELGKISCIARGAKKSNSPLLASCQIFVYSEFVLYKGTGFYHINSSETLDTFYSLRTNIEKLEQAYELTKIAHNLNVEAQDAKDALSLYLNTIYVISKMDKPYEYISSVYRLKQLQILGFAPNVYRCSKCQMNILESNEDACYDLNTNSILCQKCGITQNSLMKLSQAVYSAIAYVESSSIKKVFSFDLKDKALKNFAHFVKCIEIT